MTLKEQLTNDLKEAMKSKNKLQKNVITMIRSDIKQIEVDKRIELNDDEVIEIISRQLKQRRDAADEFLNGGREDLAQQVKEEAEILLNYLPAQMTEDEIKEIVKNTVSELGAVSIKDMGKVMAAVMPKLKGRADGKIVNQTVKQMLT
ncbi:GatB/YqeY domain-containing protein [Serpentinicella sp. ANB-PHB4]|uniref:GatB/YqeY domain-containing protein n=1 Tax=Serpentinicella sp. ANB-PHB4 TaxID=3074076 RepID=UPI002859CBE0|nr:GatB/YqeY domain-containing protein [Serpentinicella sp. ANB-PHB4]MDR5657977.1 GatB/YqeY domain-containing protein [Serpentinicella sp. ANB-PHB4]